MQVTVIAVGKIKEKYLQDGIAEYEKRLGPLVKLKIIEIAEEKRPAHTSLSQEIPVKNAEGSRIIAAIPPESYAIALDVGGVRWSSEDLARRNPKVGDIGAEPSHVYYRRGPRVVGGGPSNGVHSNSLSLL